MRRNSHLMYFNKIVIFFIAISLFVFHLAPTVLSANNDVVINEFLANPPSGEKEWVEFYNNGSATVDLSDYYFDDDIDFDSDSGSSVKVALAGLLPSSQTCFWELPSYLNNNGDSPTLFKIENNTPLDTYTYSSSSAGLSYARIPDGGEWNFNQTPSKPFNKCIDLIPTSTLTPVPTSTPTKIPTIKNIIKTTPTSVIKPSLTPVSITVNAGLQKPPDFVLGDATMSSDEVQEKEDDDKKEIKILGESKSIIPLVLIIFGIFFIACGILVYLIFKIRESKNEAK